jgi:hypothetical protein
MAIYLKIVIAFAGPFFFTIAGYNQSVHYPVAAKYTGMGAYSKNFIDPSSVSSNQAALANIQSVSAGLYGEKRFLLQELNLYDVALCFPLEFGGIGLSAQYFGYDEYNETKLGLGYGKALGKIDIGMQINFHSLRINGYGKDVLFSFEAGAIFHISEQVYAGFHVFNPTGSKFGKNHLEKLSSAYSAGLGYEASEKIFISAEIIKEEYKPVTINAGMQYIFAKKLFARLGICTEATNLYFGVGWKWNGFRVDVTGNYHSQLGFTPGLLLVFEANRKEG